MLMECGSSQEDTSPSVGSGKGLILRDAARCMLLRITLHDISGTTLTLRRAARVSCPTASVIISVQ